MWGCIKIIDIIILTKNTNDAYIFDTYYIYTSQGLTRRMWARRCRMCAAARRSYTY
jgi:hypothetical protein